MEKSRTSFWFKIIWITYFILATLYAIITPVFEASDELWHYPMVRHLADGNPLPVQVFDPALAGPWKQEASQPPLYYYMAAALTFWIDTSDMETVRWENPHVDNGVITEDGNNNLIIHDPSLNPWQGTLLAVRLIRLFSVLLGGCTVYLTYKLAQLTIPERSDVILGSTAVLAFTPMFLFISGAVNNDNLIIPLATLALCLMVWLIKRPDVEGQINSPYRMSGSLSIYAAVLGIVIGLASLTKISGVGLFPLVWGTFFIYKWKHSDQDLSFASLLRWSFEATKYFLIVFAVAFIIAGWWYIRNVQLYDDWRGWSAFIAVLGQRAHPASLRQLWAERWGFMLSYWGLFGGVNIPMPLWVYHLLNSAVVVSVGGVAIFFIQRIKREAAKRRGKRGELFSLFSLLSSLFSYVDEYFGYVICLLWAGAVVYGIVDWATITWSSQGRLVFSALPALNILLVTGLIGWLPKTVGMRLIVPLVGFLGIVALLAPPLWIRPAYQLRYEPVEEGTSIEATFGEQLRLVEYRIVSNEEDGLTPGEALWLETEWEVLQPMTRNWSVFVHLNDPVIGQPIAQRDMYLGQGLVATSFLEPGARISNRYILRVPQTAVSPADLSLVIGLYDFASGERLPTEKGEVLLLEQIDLRASGGAFPNETAVNFEDEVMLVGFELNPRRAQAGEWLKLTLYVKPLRPLTTDYTFFAQVVDEATTRWAAVDLPIPTSEWPDGEVQTVELQMQLSEETPAQVYPLIIGLYHATPDNPFSRLQLIAEDGRPTDDFLPLTLIRVE